MTHQLLRPVEKETVRAELEHRQRSSASTTHRLDADKAVRQWRAIDPGDRSRQARERRLLGTMAEPIHASLIYRGGILRQSLQRVSRVVDSGLGEAEQAELLALIDAREPAARAFEMGPLRRLLALLPGVGSRYHRWARDCQRSAAAVALLGERMVLAREPFKHSVARLARVLGEVRELLEQLQDRVDYGKLLRTAIERERVGASAEIGDFLTELGSLLQLRLETLDASLVAHRELLLAAEVLVRNARSLIRGQRQVVAAVRAALDGHDAVEAPDRAVLAELFGAARAQLLAVTELRNEAIAEIAELVREHDRRGAARD